MKKTKMRRFTALLVCLFLSVFVWIFPMKLTNDTGRYALKASAEGYYNPSIVVHDYDIEMTLNTNRTVLVKETIVVEFIAQYLTMFYRSLPKSGAIYTDITAKCEGNTAFYYEVAENPDLNEFIDINCIGGANYGKTWTYELSYVMHQNTGDTDDRMIIDVVGFGWPVALNDVDVQFHLPVQIQKEDFALYVGFNSEMPDNNQKVQTTLSDDGKTLFMSANLDLDYIGDYSQYMAEGITLDLNLPEGTMQSYASSRVFTADFWTVMGMIALFVGGSVALFVTCRKKREIVTVVNVKAPDNMDPMKMGKWLDGVVDSEDTTSMIYYFAHKGYLLINLENEDDPVLIKKVERLPDSEPDYSKTLFKGLFRSGDRVVISDLAERFCEDVDKAHLQLPSPKMYEKKSILGFLGCGLLGTLLFFLVPLIISKKIGGGYALYSGFVFLIPTVLLLLLAYFNENYRYKWKKGAKIGVLISEIVIVAATILFMSVGFAKHVLTREATIVLTLGACACVVIGMFILSRNEEYMLELGQILGFKDFILYTEEDKIKVMLEEQPELYYKVLPYAQVLGVTNEWENKFAKILIEPPSWCVGYHMTMFDYMMMHRCMSRAMRVAMRPPQDSTVGRSGGGGSFGGFGGGGFGGGGGGAR